MKKSYYCEKLETMVNFLPDVIKYCCPYSLGLGIKIDNDKIFDYKKFIKMKKFYIKSLEKGEIPAGCENCVFLKEKDNDRTIFFEKIFNKKNLINEIIVNHFKQCDCSCIYCSQKGTYSFSTEKYDIVPILKELYKKNLVDKKNLKVEFQGGNVSVLKEFNEIIRFLNKNECKQYNILTNGIKYLDVLEELDSDAWIYLVISLDSGTRELFKKIKQVDEFDTVISNIHNYNTTEKNINIVLKYIFISGVNDNETELRAFLDIAKSLKNLHAITLELDYRDTFMSQECSDFIIPEHYYKLFDFAKIYCSENNMVLDIQPYTNKVLNEGKATSVIKYIEK